MVSACLLFEVRLSMTDSELTPEAQFTTVNCNYFVVLEHDPGNEEGVTLMEMIDLRIHEEEKTARRKNSKKKASLALIVLRMSTPLVLRMSTPLNKTKNVNSTYINNVNSDLY